MENEDKKHKEIVEGMKQIIQAIDTVGIVISGSLNEVRQDLWEIQGLNYEQKKGKIDYSGGRRRLLEDSRESLKRSLDCFEKRKKHWVNLKDKTNQKEC